MPGIDTYTKLLIHGNGADGGTSFPDSSFYERTATRVGTITTTTSTSKFGGSSILIDSSGEGLTHLADSSLNFGNNNFVIEAWVKPIDSTPRAIIQLNQIGSTVGTGSDWLPWLHFTFGLTQFDCAAINKTPQTSVMQYRSNYSAISTSEFTHFAAVRSSTNFYFFINGQSQTFLASPYTPIGTSSIDAGILPLRYGYNLWSNTTALGYSNEYRISIGTDRGWTSNFTPPSTVYDDSDPSYDPAKGYRVALVGDSSNHGGTIQNSNTDGSLEVGGIDVAAHGASHSCPIPGHGTTSISAVITGSYVNGKLILTQLATAGCGAKITPPDRNVYVE